MKLNSVIFYISTGLLTMLMLFSVQMYLLNTLSVKEMFLKFGYPDYLVYPLAIAKVLGLIAIWFINNKTLKEWAYAGFFFDFILAFFAHYMIKDGGELFSVFGIVLIITSYIFYKRKTI
jgi:hypothetical protein